ncbi:MAG: ABC transporter permease [Chloroflexota bacterium]|nr:ABC transporter permease [Chloroflexota bacterium]
MATTATAQAATPARQPRSFPTAQVVSLGLPTLVLLLFFVLPIVLIAIYSFYSINPETGLMQQDFTWENYERALTSPIYRNIFWRTLGIAALATGIALLLAYPIGYFIGAVAQPKYQGPLLLLVLIPFWTSYIIRTYAWIGILQSNGFLDSVLGWVPGLPTELLYSRAAVIIGFVHVFLPIMILPIYASARNLDKRYIEAAHDLGASPLRAFLRVVLPLTMPGIVAGIVLFFIPTFGAFVTPQFLGGTGDQMMGNIISEQFKEAFNWPFGAALSIIMTLVVIVAVTLFFRFADVEEIYGS